LVVYELKNNWQNILMHEFIKHLHKIDVGQI